MTTQEWQFAYNDRETEVENVTEYGREVKVTRYDVYKHIKTGEEKREVGTVSYDWEWNDEIQEEINEKREAAWEL